MRSEVPSSWALRTLYELAEYVNGRATRPTERSRNGVPVIKIAELHRGISSSTDRVPASAVAEKQWVRDGDLLFAWSGSVGVHVYRGEPAALNQHIFRVVARDGVDQSFLRYLLEAQMPLFVRFVESKRTTMGHVTVADLKATQVAVPPPEEQERIASVLGALDDKIDSNRRLARLLEQIAQTEFQARFVDFVGVGPLVDSEIGPVPKGWLVRRLPEAIEINPRVSITKGQVAPFVAMADVAPWATRPSVVGERPFNGGCRFEPGDTLMARITGCIEHGKGAFIDFIDGPGAGSTEFLVFRARESLTPEAVFFLSRMERLRSYAIANMTGSSGRQRVQISALQAFRLAIPPEMATWSDTAELLRSTLRKTRGLWKEIRTLSAIRDALLPKLVSGEIRVPDTADPDEVIGPLVDEAA